MNKSKLFRLSVVPLMLITLQSCFVARQYTRPEIVHSQYFRTDSLAQDSATLDNMSVREMFNDTILVSHIEKALEQNIDIRVAVQQILTARAYYLQGRAGYLPQVNAAARVTYQELARNSQFGEFFDGAVTQYEITGGLSWEADI